MRVWLLTEKDQQVLSGELHKLVEKWLHNQVACILVPPPSGTKKAKQPVVLIENQNGALARSNTHWSGLSDELAYEVFRKRDQFRERIAHSLKEHATRLVQAGHLTPLKDGALPLDGVC
ncbi:hypothetical protein EV685_1141 [Sphaerotilus mobilis]|uniref:Uncharacterized protein n=1 Tax=Sphaerotilus mobilis TaxID=47994 RepID=A0A4Q7LR14_9BURK|nr:hypothetical protein EV685_1141 [Sphaerotilus mobilis]